MVMEQEGIPCRLTIKELNALCRNRRLVHAILRIVSLAFDDQSVSSDVQRKEREKAQRWIESLNQERKWVLLCILRRLICLGKSNHALKLEIVERALELDQVRTSRSLDAPVAEGSERTLLDSFPYSAGDISDQLDPIYLNSALTDRLRCLLDDREFRLLQAMYLSGERRTIEEVFALGIIERKKGKGGRMISCEGIRQVQKVALGKLKGDRVLWELFQEINS